MPDKSPQAYRWFRPALGILAVVAGLTGLLALYWVEVPEGNMQALLLGLGIVLGWGSSVVQSEYGSTTTGRRLAEKVTDAVKTE